MKSEWMHNRSPLKQLFPEKRLKFINSDFRFISLLLRNCLENGEYDYHSLICLKDSYKNSISPRTIDFLSKKFVALGLLQKQKNKHRYHFILQLNNPLLHLIDIAFFKRINFKNLCEKNTDQKRKNEQIKQKLSKIQDKLVHCQKLTLNCQKSISSFSLELIESCLQLIRNNHNMNTQELEKALKELILNVFITYKGDSFQKMMEEIRSFNSSFNLEDGYNQSNEKTC